MIELLEYYIILSYMIIGFSGFFAAVTGKLKRVKIAAITILFFAPVFMPIFFAMFLHEALKSPS